MCYLILRTSLRNMNKEICIFERKTFDMPEISFEHWHSNCERQDANVFMMWNAASIGQNVVCPEILLIDEML